MRSNRGLAAGASLELEYMKVDAAHEKDALRITLAEYKALREEIQNRSNAQSFILQVHITALTFILGAIATTKFFPWLIFLIPIEASIFGLWYVDHAVTIAQLGEYIQMHVEPSVNKFTYSSGLMSWESGFYGEKISRSSEKKPISFESLVFLTFGGPSVVALIAGALNVIFSLPLTRPLLTQGYFASVPDFYPEYSSALALAAMFVCTTMLLAYVRLTEYQKRMVKARRKSAQIQHDQQEHEAQQDKIAPILETVAAYVPTADSTLENPGSTD